MRRRFVHMLLHIQCCRIFQSAANWICENGSWSSSLALSYISMAARRLSEHNSIQFFFSTFLLQFCIQSVCVCARFAARKTWQCEHKWIFHVTWQPDEHDIQSPESRTPHMASCWLFFCFFFSYSIFWQCIDDFEHRTHTWYMDDCTMHEANWARMKAIGIISIFDQHYNVLHAGKLFYIISISFLCIMKLRVGCFVCWWHLGAFHFLLNEFRTNIWFDFVRCAERRDDARWTSGINGPVRILNGATITSEKFIELG